MDSEGRCDGEGGTGTEEPMTPTLCYHLSLFPGGPVRLCPAQLTSPRTMALAQGRAQPQRSDTAPEGAVREQPNGVGSELDPDLPEATLRAPVPDHLLVWLTLASELGASLARRLAPNRNFHPQTVRTLHSEARGEAIPNMHWSCLS